MRLSVFWNKANENSKATYEKEKVDAVLVSYLAGHIYPGKVEKESGSSESIHARCFWIPYKHAFCKTFRISCLNQASYMINSTIFPRLQRLSLCSSLKTLHRFVPWCLASRIRGPWVASDSVWRLSSDTWTLSLWTVVKVRSPSLWMFDFAMSYLGVVLGRKVWSGTC